MATLRHRAVGHLVAWWAIFLAWMYWILPELSSSGWTGEDTAIFFGGYGLWSAIVFLLLWNTWRGGGAMISVAWLAIVFGVITAVGILTSGVVTVVMLIAGAGVKAPLATFAVSVLSTYLLWRSAWLIFRSTRPRSVSDVANLLP